MRFDPVKKCVFDPPRPATLSLYVAGLNHSRLEEASLVTQAGLTELFEAVTQSVDSPENLVVALSESNRLDGCVAGNKIGEDKIAQSGECLTHALERHYEGKKFQYTSWHWWEGTVAGGGAAVITGSRWRVTGSHRIREGQDHGQALLVEIQDSRDPKVNVPVYVFHTRNNEEGAEDVANVVAVARTRMRRDLLAPIFVGDFNAGIGSPVAGEYFQNEFDWWNLNNVCNDSETGRTQDFALQGQILHIIGGKRGGKADFSCTSGYLNPVSLKYSRAPTGEPTSKIDGIRLPNVAHNVPAMDFEIVAETAICAPDNQKCYDDCAHDWAEICLPTCKVGTAGLRCRNACEASKARCESRCG